MSKNHYEFVKKLDYLSRYRGCRESEIIFTKFAKKHLYMLTFEQLKEYEIILECTDAELLDWLMNKKKTPDYINNNKLYNLLVNCLEV